VRLRILRTKHVHAYPKHIRTTRPIASRSPRIVGGAEQQVRVNCLSPGMTLTPIWGNPPSDAIQAYHEKCAAQVVTLACRALQPNQWQPVYLSFRVGTRCTRTALPLAAVGTQHIGSSCPQVGWWRGAGAVDVLQ
jgi:hypothetical protein